MKGATLLLCLSLVAGSMAALNSPMDLVAGNPDAFRILTALAGKADAAIADALKNGDLENTYFLPIDESFLYDLSGCWPAAAPAAAASNDSETTDGPTVDDIVAKIEKMDAATATNIIKAHVVGGKNLKNTADLVTADTVASANSKYNLTFSDSGMEPTYITVSVVPLDTAEAENATWGFDAALKVPVGISTGKSTVYLVDKMLANPALISGLETCPVVDDGAGDLSPSPDLGLDASPLPADDAAATPPPAKDAKADAPAPSRKLFQW